MSCYKTAVTGLLLLSVLPLFMWACSKQQDTKSKATRIALEIKPDGNILMDGKEVQPKELASTMRQKAIAASIEIIDDRPVSLLEVLIKAKRGDRYGRISGLVGVCATTGIRRLYFSHPDVNKGEEIKAWLPVVTGDPLLIALQEFRIKMLWVDRKNPETKLYSSDDPQGTKGMLLLKAGPALLTEENKLMKENKPDWEGLKNALQLSVQRFEPTDECLKLPVRIDPMAKVDFSDVLKCVLICQQQDIGELSFVQPEDHFYGK